MGRVPRWVGQSLRSAGWAPLSLFLLHAAISTTDLYRTHAWLDIPMHLLGGLAIAFFFDRSLRLAVASGLVGEPSPLLLGALVFSCTCTAAVFWELAEWSLDLYFEAPDQLGLEDTLLDMLRGILGGAFYLVASRAWRRRGATGAARAGPRPGGRA